MTKVKKKHHDKRPAHSRAWNLLCVAILIVVTVLLYLNSLGGDFVWDDRSLIVQNPQMQQPGLALTAFTQPLTIFGSNYGYYRPIPVLSLALDQWLWGGNPAGFHVTNLLLHIAVVVCVFFLFSRLTDLKTGFIAAMLFASFACHVENIAFISGRMDVLATLFMILCLWLYFRRARSSPVTLAACMLCALLALLSKELALILPFVFLVTVLLFTPRPQWKQHWVKGIVCIGIPLVVYIIVRLLVIRSLNAPVSDVFSFGERLLMIPATLVRYVQLVIVPYNLNARQVLLPPQYSGTGRFIIMLLIAIVMLGLFAIAGRRHRVIACGGAWFLLGILPVLNIIPLRGQVIAERFLYFPSAGFALALAGTIGFITRRKGKPRTIMTVLVLSALALIFINNVAFTILRNPVWRTEESFFSTMVRQSPESPLAHHNLGYVYYRQGQLEKAEREYRKALELNPAFPDSRATLGDVLTRTGRYEEAVHQYRMYLNLCPDAPNRARTLEVIDMLMKQIARDSIEHTR